MKTQISIVHCGGKRLIRMLALLLACALAPSMLRAQVPDPTGAWLLRWEVTFTAGEGPLVLNVFHQGGTLTGDIQGESAFAPHATTKPKAPLNVITTPLSGVWQKTGFNTFAATFEVIEYEVQTKPPASPVFQLSKGQYLSGTLNAAGDRMTIHVVLNHYDANGKVTEQPFEFDATGVRIPVETSPSTGPLPIP